MNPDQIVKEQCLLLQQKEVLGAFEYYAGDPISRQYFQDQKYEGTVLSAKSDSDDMFCL